MNLRLLPILLSVTLHADLIHWVGSADALYWKPSMASFDYVQERDAIRAIAPNYHWGLRATTLLASDRLGSALSLAGLYYRARDFAFTRGENLVAGLLIGGDQRVVSASVTNRYWMAEFRIGHTWACNGCCSAAFGVGGRYIDLAQDESITAMMLTAQTQYSARGAGPGISMGISAIGWEFIQLRGRMSFWGFVTSRDARYSLTNMPLTCFARSTGIQPALDLLVAIHTAWSIACLGVVTEVGYELHYFWDVFSVVPSFTISSGNILPWTQRRDQSLGFAGPYLRLGVLF